MPEAEAAGAPKAPAPKPEKPKRFFAERDFGANLPGAGLHFFKIGQEIERLHGEFLHRTGAPVRAE